jgi:hypothetical protein
VRCCDSDLRFISQRLEEQLRSYEFMEELARMCTEIVTAILTVEGWKGWRVKSDD